ncbi:hypothetical protein HI914_07220 [Erysiphe necator]|nr:hypothetical protein HI914_07220 [Erysiphe necator]
MEDPVRQTPNIIRLLTEGSPTQQQEAIQSYFLQDASFVHPLCRVPSFSHMCIPLLGNINSRWVISAIYRYYKIISPRIIITIESINFDRKTSTLYCELRQIFSPISLPFYRANVHLTCKILLHHSLNDDKYYIQKQEDLYQSSELVKFFGPGYSTLVLLQQLIASIFCVIGAFIFAPITWFEQMRADNKRKQLNGVRKCC